MTTKKISSEKAWEKIEGALNLYYIAVPIDFSDVYTKMSDIPKDIKGIILFREYYNMFLFEFKDSGEIIMTCGDPRDAQGLMKDFYEHRTQIVSGAYNSPEVPSYQDHKYIDLGLPSGNKWARADVGRYAWAETIGKESFSKSSARKRTKFSDIKGDAKMDAARVHWGSKWRTPTPEDFQELIDNCKWQWRGWGYLLTGLNGKQLYLSACGYNDSAWGPLKKQVEGYYWTTASKEGEDNATCLFFNKDEMRLEWNESYMGMCVRPVFNDAESEPETKQEDETINPEDYNKGIVKEKGTLKEKYIFSGDKHWKTGNRATAQRKIKTGDIVELKFLGAGEEKIRVNEWNPVWEMDETITVMGENFYFEVIVNDKQAYYAKIATRRNIKESDTMGGGVTMVVGRTGISEKEVLSAFGGLKHWLSDGAKNNNYWHGLYKKSEFPEKIVYGMPGEEAAAPVEEASWKVGEIIEEGEGIFTYDGIRYEVYKECKNVDGKYKDVPSLKVLPLKGSYYSGKVTVPETVTYHRRKLTVTWIESDAFDNCPELIEINLPSTISRFSGINGSHKLERVAVAEGNPEYHSEDGVVYAVSHRFGSDKKGGYSILCCYPFAHGEHFVVPDFVRSVDVGVFEGCQMLKSVIFSDNVTIINKSAFKDCTNLESVTWGTGLEDINEYAFENCTALKNIVLADSVTYVSHNAFKGCSNIESITFSKGKYFDLDGISSDLFPWGKMPFVLDGVRYRPEIDYKRRGEASLVVDDFPKEEVGANINADVHTVIIPPRVEQYGFVYKVSDCRSSFKQFPSLERIELPATVQKINIANVDTLQDIVVDDANPDFSAADGLLFNKQRNTLLVVPRGRNIKKLVIPDGVEVIAENACSRQSYIEEVIIPDSTIAIEKEAFASCGSLHDVHLGNGIKKIGIGSFAYTAIEHIVLPPSARFVNQETWDGKTAFYRSKLKSFKLDGENELYTVIDGILYIKTQWGLRLKFCPSAYEGHLQVPEGVYEIGKLSCCGCTELKSVFVPEGVERLGDDAFTECVKLENIEFDGHIDKIGRHCFYGCTSLKEVDCIGVKEIEDTAFRGIKGLKLNLPYALEHKRPEFEKFMAR